MKKKRKYNLPDKYVITCPHCSFKTPVAYRDCMQCHRELPREYVEAGLEQIKILCPHCGAMILPTAEKCMFCGEWINRQEQEEGEYSRKREEDPYWSFEDFDGDGIPDMEDPNPYGSFPYQNDNDRE